jgi:hypothetical protein
MTYSLPTADVERRIPHLNALTASIYDYFVTSGTDPSSDFSYNLEIANALAAANLPCVSLMNKSEILKLWKDTDEAILCRYVFLPTNLRKDNSDWQAAAIDGSFPGKVPVPAIVVQASKRAITESEVSMIGLVTLLYEIQLSKKADLQAAVNAARLSAAAKN